MPAVSQSTPGLSQNIGPYFPTHPASRVDHEKQTRFSVRNVLRKSFSFRLGECHNREHEISSIGRAGHKNPERRAEDGVGVAGSTPIEACELRKNLGRRFARWQVPDNFVFLNQLPYTSTGKLRKSKLRSNFFDWEWDRA
jgi:acyl-CoA synthetase (AMP-forming)/AMP-acid ligase II